jgi:putative effector of murein hydrolase LrgA (UPF0299 family)
MIASLSLILLCQLIGEVFVRGLGLPMPGPVIGLLLLLLLLLAACDFPRRSHELRGALVTSLLVPLAVTLLIR